MFYDLKGLTKKLNERFKWDIAYISIFNYWKKGFLKPTTIYVAGKKRYPLFSEQDIDRVAFQLNELNKKGVIRIHKL